MMHNFNVAKYYQLVQEPMQTVLMNYAATAFEIPGEEQTGEKGRQSMLWKMIPWFKKVMEYLQMTEDSVR